MPQYRARGLGLTWLADIALDPFDPLPDTSDCPNVVVARVSRLVPRANPSPINRGAIYPDGFRFGWDDQAVFDGFDGTRIDYCPGTDWRGTLPSAFFSTVAGLVLAQQGLVPLHASAVEVSGAAFLISGPAGSGKSTLAAELLAAGARLVSDDLTALKLDPLSGKWLACRGRRSISLHPATAEGLAADKREPIAEDPRGKVLVWPRNRIEGDTLPVGGLIVLDDRKGNLDGPDLAPILRRLLFRPSWVSAMPSRAVTSRLLVQLASDLSARQLPKVAGFTAAESSRRSSAALAAITDMLESGYR